DVYDRAAFEGSTHVTPAERAALASLRGAGLTDVVPRPLKYEHPFTYWDYRQLCFPKNRGMRIDLVYGNEAFAKAVTDSYVDREERKGKGASDHAPVVVDLDVAPDACPAPPPVPLPRPAFPRPPPARPDRLPPAGPNRPRAPGRRRAAARRRARAPCGAQGGTNDRLEV